MDLFLYPLKMSENKRFYDVFKSYRKRSVAWNGVMKKESFGFIFKIHTEVWTYF